ncbi:MAG: hypothetical protein NTZ59_02675 [Bacteroidetes bacterium]|nr:hypothetical protein [Bacteroidota bacterium]
MIKLILTTLLLCICIIAFNQKVNNTEKILLRFSPLSLIDIYHPSATFGAELTTTKKQAFGLDVSLLINTLAVDNVYRTGFIIKPTYKFFVDKLKENFIELDCFWKKNYWEESRWGGREYQNGIPSYYQKEDYNVVKNVLGLNVKFGSRIELFDGFVFVELYVGLGARVTNHKVKEHPDETIEVKKPFFIDNQKALTNVDVWGLSIPMGVRIVFAVK